MSHRPTLAAPAFPDDDGAVDPGLAVALDEFARDQVLPPVLAALHGVRILYPSLHCWVTALPAATRARTWRPCS